MGQLPHGRRSARSLFVRDIVQGALLGDFAHDLGLPGAAMQVALNFVPVVGSLCALRDVAANWRVKDRTGVALNLLAIIPFIGSVAKAAEIWRHVGRLRRGFDVSFRIRRQPAW